MTDERIHKYPAESLTFSEFSRHNRRRAEAEDGYSRPLKSWSKSDWMVAAGGELGEAQNIVKKMNRIRDGYQRNDDETIESLMPKLADEIADTILYLDLLAQSLGLELETLLVNKFNATSFRDANPYFFEPICPSV